MVTAAKHPRIVKFRPMGNPSRPGTKGTGPGELDRHAPTGDGLQRDDCLWRIGNARIQIFDQDGNSPSRHQSGEPSGLAIVNDIST
jgi:hypothetical protein